MPLHAYRVGDFSHTHERQGFRKLVENLKAKNINETIYVVGNPTFPKVTYHYPNSNRTRDFESVNPDAIIFKHGAIAILEMKAYSGIIYFPQENDHIWDAWTYEHEGLTRIINEGNPSPLSQVDTNYKALIAFLKQHENDFGDDYCKDSQWHKAQKIILFTEEGTSFSAKFRPTFWRNTYVSTLDNIDKQFDFASIASDITTPPRKYKQDERPLISLNDNIIEAIIHILGAQKYEAEIPITQQPLQPVVQTSAPLEQELFSPGYGVVSVIPGSRARIVQNRPTKTVNVPQGIVNKPLPIRIIRYYSYCLMEEAKLSSQLNMKQLQNYYAVQNTTEPIFFGTGSFTIDGKALNQFLKASMHLIYGFLFVIRRDNKGLTGAPLFMTDVNLRQDQNGQSICSPIAQNDIIINRQALRGLSLFSKMSEEEIEHYIGTLENLPNTISKISKVVSDIGLGNVNRYTQIPSFDPAKIARGVMPIALVFRSHSGIYERTIGELNKIAALWEQQTNKKLQISDLAWCFLNGITEKDLDQTWKPALLSIVPSNYEQSQATGLSFGGNNKLQVISGPPGTGKSQVVQNIFANAYLSKRSVLFASKNNKAIDVVIDRLNDEVIQLPLAVRSGNIGQNKEFIQKLQTISPQSPSTNHKTQKQLDLNDLRRQNQDLIEKHKEINQFYEYTALMKALDAAMKSVREECEDLFSLTYWYDRQATDFGVSAWQNLYDEFRNLIEKSKSFYDRVRTKWRFKHSGIRWIQVISSKSFHDALEKHLSSELKINIPKNLYDLMQDVGTIDACERILPNLKRLVELNKQLINVRDFLEPRSEDTLLQEFEDMEKNKIISSKNILSVEWYERNSSNNNRAQQSVINILQSVTPNANIFSQALDGFSCWATTSLSMASNIPFEPELCDLVVVDEASQSDMASALPILYRGKRAVIIGDEMQLRPIILLDKEFDGQIATAFALDDDAYDKYGYSRISLLDLAYDRFTKAGGHRLLLKNHYRSHPDIIAFSNQRFYNNHLRIKTDSNNRPGIFWHDIQGNAAARWINVKEATKVAELINNFRGQGFQYSQIGVVTPFRMQAEHIRQQLNAQNISGVTVEPAHGFQGDEKQVMIFSLVLGGQMPPGTILWVHNLATDSKNLLNVALTRAQKELHIVGNKDLCRKAGGLLKLLVEYVEGC